MKRLLPPPAPVLALAAVLAAAGPASAQQVVATQSEIGFVSKQMGVPVRGRFRQWTAQIALDPKHVDAGKVAFTIQTGSASFGAAETEAEVAKPDWFDVARFPTAGFASSSIKALGGGRFEVRGRLTIKGITHDVVVPVAITQSGAASTAAGSFVVKRLDFRIGEGDWADTSLVASEVTVDFKLAVTGLAPR